MNRRTALKQAALFTGGVAILPSCIFGPERVAIALNNLQLDVYQQNALAEIVEAIIPSGEIPGAKELDIYQFVLVMVDDCVEKPDQEIFISGFQKFALFVKDYFEKPFNEGDQIYKEKVLTDILSMDESKEASILGLKDIRLFLSITKKYSIQGYMSSKYIMTEKFPYKHVPGPYFGCVSTDGLIVM